MQIANSGQLSIHKAALIDGAIFAAKACRSTPATSDPLPPPKRIYPRRAPRAERAERRGRSDKGSRLRDFEGKSARQKGRGYGGGYVRRATPFFRGARTKIDMRFLRDARGRMRRVCGRSRGDGGVAVKLSGRPSSGKLPCY